MYYGQHTFVVKAMIAAIDTKMNTEVFITVWLKCYEVSDHCLTTFSLCTG